MGGSRFSVLVNCKKKQTLILDNKRNRLRRLQRRVRSFCDLMAERGKVGRKLVMITLTYGAGEWHPNDIRDFMLWLRKQENVHVHGYVWVAELQARGAVHYHVMVYVDKADYIPKPDVSGGWSHGLTKVEGAKTPYYALKYSGKEYQKDFDKFPKGIRAFSVWVDDGTMAVALRYQALKNWERFYVDTEGWDSLNFWRKHQRSINGWVCWSHFDDPEEAQKEVIGWEYVFGLSGGGVN